MSGSDSGLFGCLEAKYVWLLKPGGELAFADS